jgi:hypothetical protein
MTNYRKITAVLIGAWFVAALTASALHLFRADSSRPPLPLALAGLIPIVAFSLWFARSESFRQFALSLNPGTLTLLHSWRVGGFTFLVLYTFGILPGLFALPAGLGDFAIGATASYAALKLANPNHRSSFIRWHALGILDLVVALTLGATASLIYPQGVPTTPLTVLPLSLIPTFVVPLLLILHVICIAQARRWPARKDSLSPLFLPRESTNRPDLYTIR